MKKKTCIVTGSAGLIGSQSVKFFIEKGYYVVGIDNDMRSYFFGPEASTKDSHEKLANDYPNDFRMLNCDIRDYETLDVIFKSLAEDGIDIIIHCAAQPSHDWAAKEPITDFTINANGTLNLLELTRKYCPEATFIYTSTNKVYGDRPNYYFEDYRDHFGKKPKNVYNPNEDIKITEGKLRYEAMVQGYHAGLYAVPETMPVDGSMHSIFGASKLSADIMCQEYGKYFNMPIAVFRGGCLTGPNHAGAELHGFLSYLVKCIVQDKPYTIFGYKGKQVRDNIHSWDLVNMFWNYHQNPSEAGVVYNAGGGRGNDTSILEAINTINKIAGTSWDKYTISDINRVGDHIWYISDLNKFKRDYPNWDITITLEDTIKQMIEFEKL